MPPAIVAAGIGAAGAIGGGLLASSGASHAANTEARAQQQAILAQQQQTAQTRADLAPYRDAGSAGLTQYGNLLGTNGAIPQQAAITALQNSPYYQSLYRNGLEANLANASATGGIRGGNEVRSLANFGSDTLAQTVQQQLGNLYGLAGLGEGASAQTAALGQSGANNISGIDMTGGDNQASAQLMQAGALSGMFKNIAGYAQYAINPLGSNSAFNTGGNSGLPDYNPAHYGF